MRVSAPGTTVDGLLIAVGPPATDGFGEDRLALGNKASTFEFATNENRVVTVVSVPSVCISGTTSVWHVNVWPC